MIRQSIRRIGFVFAFAALVSVTGMLLRAQLPQDVNTWESMGPVSDARSGAAAVALPDGLTLIAGGIDTTGQPTDSVVVYDPLANSFATAGHLISARVDHSATLLADGRVLIVGGMTNGVVSSDIEIFDLSSGTSALVALMAQPRTGHASALLGDETVVIVGGSTVDRVVLQSAEIFDPYSESVTAVPSSLQQARTGASATTLIDGRVLVVGGSNESGDLNTAEIFEPVGQTFTIVDTTLSVPRSGHTATLLPHNNGVLVSGGTATIVSDGIATSVPVTATDVFVPAIFTDPYTWGMGSFIQSDEMQQPRSRAVGGPAGDAGYAFTAGGGPNDAEAYRYATIVTDQDDYTPGEHAIITGSGWQPFEKVTLLFQEDPAVHPDYAFPVTANANGDIYWDQWAPEGHDLGVRFYLTAQDSRSRAQTTFTDANNFNITPLTQSVTAGSTNNFTWTLTATNNGNEATTTFTIPSDWPAPQIAAGPNQVTVTGCTSGFTIGIGAASRVITITQSGTGGGGRCGTGQTLTISYLNVIAPTPVTPPQTYTFDVDDAATDPTVTVTANVAPTAQAQSVTTSEDTAVSVTLTGTDAGTCELTFSIVSPPTNGSLGSITNQACTPGSPNSDSATVTYTPSANFNGSDSFTYKVNDGSLDSPAATVSITVTAVNDPPVAVDDSYNATEDTLLNVAAPGVLTNDTDVDTGDASTAVLVSGPAHAASFTLHADGSFSYMPAPNYCGPDSFTYKANDGDADSNIATVTITVACVNDPPVAVDDSYNATEDTPLTIAAPGVLTNDTDVDTGDASTAVLVSGPAHAAASRSRRRLVHLHAGAQLQRPRQLHLQGQ